MKQLAGLLLLFAFLTSCSESFRTINPSRFNGKIAGRSDIDSPEELITLYYDYPPNEGTPRLTITTKDLGNDRFEITLINDHLEDDSLAAEKIVMTAKKIGMSWAVLAIKTNWKCWDDRGHTSWGTGSCG